MTEKKQRNKRAREVRKITGLSLPQAHQFLKAIKKRSAWDVAEEFGFPGVGQKMEEYPCSCCDHLPYTIYEHRGRRFTIKHMYPEAV